MEPSGLSPSALRSSDQTIVGPSLNGVGASLSPLSPLLAIGMGVEVLSPLLWRCFLAAPCIAPRRTLA